MSKKATESQTKVVVLTETYQPVSASDCGQRTFRPHGSGQVPASVPPLPSGVAPAAQPQSTPQPAPTSNPQSGNGAGSQGGN